MAELLFRRAKAAEVPLILRMMHTARNAMEDPTRYIPDDAAFVSAHIQREGFTLLAQLRGKDAAFLLVRLPGLAENNLGRHLGLDDGALRQVAQMESVAVLPEFQGHGLQKALLAEGERQLPPDYRHLLATVSPENPASLRSFLALGYEVRQTFFKYGTMERNLMYRLRA